MSDDNIIPFNEQERKNKNTGEPTNPTDWPKLRGSSTQAHASPPQAVNDNEPQSRRLLIDLGEDGELVIDGFLGLTGSFLAVGDGHGRIKFAAAEGAWRFCTDVTDHPDYQDDLVEVYLEDDSDEED